MLFLCLTSTIEDRPYSAARVEELLLARIAEGDSEAFAQLYTETRAAVYGFVLSILKDARQAEDAMQEVYLRIYAAAAAYQPRQKPMAWILTIARNEALMKLRQRKAAGEVPLEDAWQHPDTQDQYRTSEDRLLLQSVMKQLPQQERQIVMLHSLSGLKHREIAEILQLPLSTVLSKYRRALSKMKKRMEED